MSDLLELELQAAVSCHVSAGNRTQVLCERSQGLNRCLSDWKGRGEVSLKPGGKPRSLGLAELILCYILKWSS